VTAYCLTTSRCNFLTNDRLGWMVQGIKRRRRPTAEALRPGDKIVYYVSQVMAFAATAEVTGTWFEDHELHWTSGPGEDYPWRVPIRPEVVLPESDWIPAAAIQRELEFPRKWPAEHWRLAFQGNIRAWPDADYETVAKNLIFVASSAGKPMITAR
jgi:EVE domain-containing protein